MKVITLIIALTLLMQKNALGFPFKVHRDNTNSSNCIKNCKLINLDILGNRISTLAPKNTPDEFQVNPNGLVSLIWLEPRMLINIISMNELAFLYKLEAKALTKPSFLLSTNLSNEAVDLIQPFDRDESIWFKYDEINRVFTLAGKDRISDMLIESTFKFNSEENQVLNVVYAYEGAKVKWHSHYNEK